jgi:hypothetical protein
VLLFHLADDAVDALTSSKAVFPHSVSGALAMTPRCRSTQAVKAFQAASGVGSITKLPDGVTLVSRAMK